MSREHPTATMAMNEKFSIGYHAPLHGFFVSSSYGFLWHDGTIRGSACLEGCDPFQQGYWHKYEEVEAAILAFPASTTPAPPRDEAASLPSALPHATAEGPAEVAASPCSASASGVETTDPATASLEAAQAELDAADRVPVQIAVNANYLGVIIDDELFRKRIDQQPEFDCLFCNQHFNGHEHSAAGITNVGQICWDCREADDFDKKLNEYPRGEGQFGYASLSRKELAPASPCPDCAPGTAIECGHCGNLYTPACHEEARLIKSSQPRKTSNEVLRESLSQSFNEYLECKAKGIAFVQVEKSQRRLELSHKMPDATPTVESQPPRRPVVGGVHAEHWR